MNLKDKFLRQEESRKNVDHSLHEFMSTKKESNMYRFLDHDEKMQKVRRGQSAYKKNLVDRILEKSNRAREVSDRKFRVSEIAVQQ